MWNATTTAAVAMSHLEIKDTLAEIAAWSAANDGQLDIKIGSKRGGKSRQSSVMIKVTVTAQNKSVRSWNVIGELEPREPHGMRGRPSPTKPLGGRHPRDPRVAPSMRYDRAERV